MSTQVEQRRSSFGSGLRTRAKPWTLIAGALVGVIAWEIVARTLGLATLQASQIMPSLTTIATDGLLGLSNFHKGAFGIEATSGGAEQSVLGAFLALSVNAAITLGRVLSGLVLAVILGCAFGLLISGVRQVRLSVTGIAELMRMLPTLAMAPLFILWFGATNEASILFIIFGVAFIMMIATTNAVQNLAPEIIDYPRTLGIGRIRLYLSVVLPAILPELRGPLLFAGLIAWTSSLASEIYGLQSGLGWMLSQTLRFSLVDQMFIVAVVFSALALATMRSLSWMMRKLTVWNE